MVLPSCLRRGSVTTGSAPVASAGEAAMARGGNGWMEKPRLVLVSLSRNRVTKDFKHFWFYGLTQESRGWFEEIPGEWV